MIGAMDTPEQARERERRRLAYEAKRGTTTSPCETVTREVEVRELTMPVDESAPKDSGFDKAKYQKEYMRAYMRRKRAKEKE